MKRIIIWNTLGRVLNQFEDLDEALEWMEECGHEEIDRTYKGRDTNIVILEAP